jgi:SAM-dependent methyltransferase
MSSETEGTGQADLDYDRLTELLQQVVNDTGAAAAVPLALVGDRLGLFTALADGKPVTSDELATRTGMAERYIREWLLAMAASNYVTYVGDGSGPDAKRSARYRLSPEQAEAFTNAESPAYVAGLLQNLSAAARMTDRLTEAFHTGEGIPWGEQHKDVFEGTERTFRPGYVAQLVSSWIPLMTGTAERLTSGGRVADVGCGFGAATIIMAQAYPNSTFVGLDSHAASTLAATERAAAAGVGNQVAFRTAGAAELDGTYDLITFFDCVHDMPDPIAALQAARQALTPDGRVMMVEPMSWDTVDETLNPMGRLMASASMLLCLPSGLSDAPAYGMGNQAGPSATARIAEKAGFSGAEIVTTTQFNLVYQLVP